MADEREVDLGEVQRTLIIPLAARARESREKRPLLRDPKAVEILESADFDLATYGRDWGGALTVLRTAVYDGWVREFLGEHPGGTVVEIGTGLNTRFERVDDGRVHWIDLDLPDAVALRRRFFADTERRRTVAASFLDEEWLEAVGAAPGPYFFVADGVLVYLPEPEVTVALARLARRFPGARIAFDTYTRASVERQHKAAERRGIAARWAWACDDPRALGPLGLTVLDSRPVTDPPAEIRGRLSAGRRLALRALRPLTRGLMTVNLFEAARSAGAGRAA
ncbi:class I SAM-dependent methyltransferase [Phaeacidiphilus oryzae]|uniref:class I SAM-dependent methyltransferase n=1 Tax=Phaeacidiphilus oryzae TaxID=348818 RepID=UPI000565C258|nr:class I SAM-dependent methyltransferase [Phaeacidiphilus oryzae]